MSVKKDLGTLEGHLDPINHDADGINFDNSANGFTATDVQSAIEEAKGITNIPEVTADPISPAAQSAWVLHDDQAGSPIGLLLALTYAESRYRFSYKTLEGPIVRVDLK